MIFSIEIICTIVGIIMLCLGTMFGYFWGKAVTEKRLGVIRGKDAKKFYEMTGLDKLEKD